MKSRHLFQYQRKDDENVRLKRYYLGGNSDNIQSIRRELYFERV